jgi:hypothetical protein
MIGYSISLFNAAHSILARSASGGAVDPDAQAFITAAAITDPTQQSAINTLVVDLKGYSIWTKMEALYPIVGGSASSHKFNLKNPLDTNGAFRLDFLGGWIHSSTGALPNGTNAYARTYLIPSTTLSLNNSHLSFYSLTNATGSKNNSSMGSVNGLSSYHSILLKDNTNNASFVIDKGNASFVNTNSTGFYIASRTANNSLKAYKNNSLVATDTTTITALSNPFNIFIGATNSMNTPELFDLKRCAFASIGDGLTDAEALNFYTAVQAFQTTLGRQL